MKQLGCWLTAILMGLTMLGCSTAAKKIKDMQLGMTPEEVQDIMGKPFTIRAAKVFDDGQSTEVWEYTPHVLEFNPKTFWIYFENGRVVQWGEPGDFAGKSGRSVPVEEYKAFKKAR